MLLTYCFVFFFVFVGMLIIMLIMRQCKLSSIRQTQKAVNLEAQKYLKNNNFNITKIFFLNDFATYEKENKYKKFIAIDNINKKICLINYEIGNLLIVDYDEFLNYELYENGSMQTFGGNMGGFWSGIYASETNGKCEELKLIIRLKRYDITNICYDLVVDTPFNMGVDKSAQEYKQCIKSIQEVISFFEVVKNENSNNI